jgi:Uma2 family endonuclease
LERNEKNATMSILDRQLTAEEFAKLPNDGRHCELVRGRILEVNPPAGSHGLVVARIVVTLQSHLDAHPLGRVLAGDAGVITERQPDSVRGADVAFYSYHRAPRGSFRVSPYGHSPPEIVFEILSENDRWPDVLEKVAEYLRVGVVFVAVLEPEVRNVHLYTIETATILRADDDITFPNVLPAFRCRVADFFADCD